MAQAGWPLSHIHGDPPNARDLHYHQQLLLLLLPVWVVVPTCLCFAIVFWTHKTPARQRSLLYRPHSERLSLHPPTHPPQPTHQERERARTSPAAAVATAGSASLPQSRERKNGPPPTPLLPFLPPLPLHPPTLLPPPCPPRLPNNGSPVRSHPLLAPSVHQVGRWVGGWVNG